MVAGEVHSEGLASSTCFSAKRVEAKHVEVEDALLVPRTKLRCQHSSEIFASEAWGNAAAGFLQFTWKPASSLTCGQRAHIRIHLAATESQEETFLPLVVPAAFGCSVELADFPQEQDIVFEVRRREREECSVTWIGAKIRSSESSFGMQ